MTAAAGMRPPRPRLVDFYSGRSGGVTWGNHARASGGGTFRRNGVRRENGRYGGVFGSGGGGGGASAAAKPSGLGCYDKGRTGRAGENAQKVAKGKRPRFTQALTH